MTLRLSHKLALEERAQSPDGKGGLTGNWTELGVHWAHVEAMTGRFQFGEGYPRARVPYRITIRSVSPDAPSRPRPGHRFSEGTRFFLIRSVADADNDARYLTCLADEEVAA